MTSAILVIGTAALLVLSLPMVDAAMLPDGSTTLLLAAMGLSTSLLGFLLWNYAGALVPAERLGLFLYLIPAVSIIGGARFLDESLTVHVLLGCALTVFGVWVASRPGTLPRAAATE